MPICRQNADGHAMHIEPTSTKTGIVAIPFDLVALAAWRKFAGLGTTGGAGSLAG
jgi:hypothetical protein